MKTCLLFSGLARHIELGFNNIRKNLIEPNNPDIFIHTWLDEEKEGELKEKINKLYSPVKMVCESQKSFNNSNLNMERMMNSYAKPYVRDSFVNTFYSAWYSIQQANKLKEIYRLENNIIYDYSIRARFDINYVKQIECNKFDPNVLNVSDRELPIEMIDDRFAFASDRIMNLYSGIFNTIDFIHEMKDKKDGIFCGESMVYEMCKAFNIPCKKINELHLIHVR